MIILGVDIEVTDLTDDAEMIEMGGVLYDTEAKIILASYGQIYKTVEESAEGAAACHRISRDVSLQCPTIEECPDPFDVLNAKYAKYVVAHNASHDHPKVTKIWPRFLQIPWICTWQDLQHNDVVNNVTSRRLGHLCVDYGISTNTLHRAEEDARACTIMASMHDLDLAYETKLMPKFRLICSGNYLKNIDIGKLLKEAPSLGSDGRRYRWNVDGYPKCWMKENLLEGDVKADANYIMKITNNKWEFNLERMDPKPY